MDDVKKRLEKLEFHIQLLSQSGVIDNAPFANWVIKNNRSKSEVDYILSVCEEIHSQYKQQKAEGFLNFQPLLNIFQRKTHLYIKDVEEFTFVMVRENFYPDVMKEFLKIQQRIS